MMKLKRIAVLMLTMGTLFCQGLRAQQQTVSGMVTSAEEKQPLAGVTVVVKGSSTGATTNAKGEYSIAAKSGDVLLFSFLGMMPESVLVGNSSQVNMVMRTSSTDIDEVVVVGYSLVKKSDLTGSTQTVTSEDIMKNRPVSLEQGMQGRLAGVNVVKNDGAPGGGISMQIRGTNSFSSSTEPLYVIDGVPVFISNDEESMTFDENEVASRNALSFLDPNDVESIEVLKDASAIAIYGINGSNGVVMITTKSGRQTGGKLVVNATMTVSAVSNKLRMLTGAEYAEYRNQSYINTQMINSGSFSPLGLPYLGGVNSQGAYVKGPEAYNNDPYYWQDQIFRHAISQNYSINYSGASAQGDYSVGLSYLDQQGTVINSGYDRLNTNVKLNQNIRKWLKVGTSTNFSVANSDIIKAATQNQNNGDEGVIRSALYFPPIYMAEDDPGYAEYQLVSNPIAYTTAMNKQRNYNIYTTNYLNATLVKGLIFRTVFSYKASINSINRYFPRDLYEGRSVSGKSLAGDTQSQTYSWDNLLMYNRTFCKKHNVSATLGTLWLQTDGYTKQVVTQGFGTDINNGWLLADGTNPQTPKSSKYDGTRLSIISRAAYNYDSRYFLTATFRRDEASQFADNHKYAYFPSVGVAWTASNEAFLKGNKAISTLKLRYSYGGVGNSGIPSYGSLMMMMDGNYPFGSGVQPGYAPDPNYPGNPDLMWETTYQHDLGLELGLFGRATIEVDYYNKKTESLIQRRDLPPSSGKSTVQANAGNVSNSGIEVTASVNVIRSRDFKWDVGGNFAFNQNEVTSTGPDNSPIYPNNLWNDLRPYVIEKGRPVGQLIGFIEEGIWSSREEVINSAQFQKTYPGYTTASNVAATELIIKQKWIGEVKILDRDGDGVITDADQTYIGNVNPKFIYGINTSFSWKNLDMSLLFNGVYGNDIINMPSLRNHNLGQTRNIPHEILANAWAPGNNGTNPKIYTTTSRDLYFSRRYIESGSYFKLRNLSVGYTLNKPLRGIASMRVFFSGNNLFTITNYSGYDPEVNAFGSGNPSKRGVDAGGYPQAREFTFGISLTL